MLDSSPLARLRRSARPGLRALAVLPLALAVGCGTASVTASGATITAPGDGSGGTTPPVTGGGSGGGDGGGSTPDTAPRIDPSRWATGGTASMQGTYADPFGDTDGARCALTCSTDTTTCAVSTNAVPTRVDISEGQNGLPVRFALLVQDASCQPIPGAFVQIWHASPDGLYSGFTSNPGTCSNNRLSVQSADWFRGIQASDNAGRVTFDSCFPGWTPGRTVHINLAVSVPDSGGTARRVLTTELVFDDAVVQDIVATQPGYAERGPRDTTNQTDPNIGAAAASSYRMAVAQMADGAMLASYRLVVRPDTAEPLCTIPTNADGGGTPANPANPANPNTP
jgi:protocatechuate 3,4-dioxygenase beta subunit